MQTIPLFLLLSFIHLINAIYTNCNGYGNCPSQACPCQSASSLSDLVCYSYKRASGLNYALIDFGGGMTAVCSVDLRCDPGKRSRLDVLQVYGFIIEVTYPIKRCNKTDRVSKLLFVDLSRGPGCPRIFSVRNFEFTPIGRFNPAIFPVPIPASLIYLIYAQIKRGYRGQCNIFQSVEKIRSGRCPYSPYSPYTPDYEPPITSVNLAQIKSALVYTSPSSNNTAANKYINDYGICGLTCTPSPQPQEESNPPLFYNLCSTDGFNTSTNCRNYKDTIQLDQILQSYGYDKYLEDVDPYEACIISTLWAQGLDKRNKGVNSNVNCNTYTTSFCSIVILPQPETLVYEGTSNASKTGIIGVLLQGFCENSIKESILKYFLDTC